MTPIIVLSSLASSLLLVFLSVRLISTHSTFIFFFFNDTATTEIYTLSLHDALPILYETVGLHARAEPLYRRCLEIREVKDRKSTRLNSSHITISYAVFCLKKKKIT